MFPEPVEAEGKLKKQLLSTLLQADALKYLYA